MTKTDIYPGILQEEEPCCNPFSGKVFSDGPGQAPEMVAPVALQEEEDFIDVSILSGAPISAFSQIGYH
ncbi:MAG: hypothetical protein EOO06_12450 [Chitinophagaceae bacterium]|nr:MAG: hypothetical protein EOO06_12450 [Chitinophagaceae bacterium]